MDSMEKILNYLAEDLKELKHDINSIKTKSQDLITSVAIIDSKVEILYKNQVKQPCDFFKNHEKEHKEKMEIYSNRKWNVFTIVVANIIIWFLSASVGAVAAMFLQGKM